MSNANEVRIRRKTFTHEFKQECVNLVLQHKYPVTLAAETMNIGLSTLQQCWLRQFTEKSGEILPSPPRLRLNNDEYRNFKSRYVS
ncbi:transposase [Salmonella enterica]|uniref:Transposase n=3 Tax=Salmonella enterica TaxID=28901 RepID=A0A3Y9C0D1_SALEB|nr:transposase [Salmonella enterica subsp. enterica serovar Java]EAN9728582.1 transposase [Salmonella enterica]EBV8390440.1 transposase [Salmonella enterica subsp. enterica serovar Virchow]EDQ0182819.1 transposase [Salmonella enterica subsp. enterica serovar 4,[5],12:b:-]EDV9615183.1 transposase [Salmonella enterica subsp. enterica serovar Paratyphi B]EEE5612082.1 transposase [Salmonella enterica subsp. enterica serovar Typhimurium]